MPKQTAFLAVALLLILSSCKKDKSSSQNDVMGPDLNVYALTADAKLILFNANNPTATTSEVTISGLQSGETLLGIDFRPATGQLYGVGSTSRIYIIDPKTGVSRAVNATAFTPALNGTSVGFDFNPTVDRIRLITATGQNLRLNPENGLVAATDLAINGVTNAKTTAAAYTENRAGATSTVLFDIDVANDKLHRQDPPNDGKLVEVGSLGVDADDASGFDISPDGKSALAALSVGGTSALYSIDLNTGKASKIGTFSKQITGLAIPTQPVAYAISTSNQLLIFNPAAPSTPASKALTGLQTGENIIGMDMRPVNGQLYAVSSQSRIYTLNIGTGAATMVGLAPMALTLGADVGFDFNPTVDRIRIVSSTGQNLRINPADASVTVDGNISIMTSAITGAAYTNNYAGATTTVLFDIDSQNDRLYRQDPPNNGTLVDIGALGVNVEAANGFDIGGTSGIAYGIFTVGGMQKIYSVNLTSGAATAGADFPQAVRAFALGLGF